MICIIRNRHIKYVQLKLSTNLILLDQFLQKQYFWCKTEKANITKLYLKEIILNFE